MAGAKLKGNRVAGSIGPAGGRHHTVFGRTKRPSYGALELGSDQDSNVAGLRRGRWHVDPVASGAGAHLG